MTRHLSASSRNDVSIVLTRYRFVSNIKKRHTSRTKNISSFHCFHIFPVRFKKEHYVLKSFRLLLSRYRLSFFLLYTKKVARMSVKLLHFATILSTYLHHLPDETMMKEDIGKYFFLFEKFLCRPTQMLTFLFADF